MKGKLIVSQTDRRDYEFPYEGGGNSYQEAYREALRKYEECVVDATRHHVLIPKKVRTTLSDVEELGTNHVLYELKLESKRYEYKS